MIGILAEKPSAKANMSAAFGGPTGTFDGESYVIVNARGHLYEYKEPDEQVNTSLKAKYHSWSPANLPWDENDFRWIREKKGDAASLLSSIRSVLNQCDEIIIATDADPSGEGSLLGWEIIDELGLSRKKISRMFFDDESVKKLQQAFRNRKPLTTSDKDPDYKKAEFRTRWDMLSMQFTRVATYFGDGKTVLRNGRLKSAMLVLVGDQLMLISNYKKIPFYQNRFRDENGVMYTNPEEPSFPKKDDVPNSYSVSSVVVDKKERKFSAPPALLDLAGLASRLEAIGYKAKDVQTVYQTMYEKGIVSYPRTEDKFITQEQFNDLLPLVDKIAKVVGVNASLLTHRVPRSTHVVNGGCDHGANRPGMNVPNKLDDLLQYGDCAPVIYKLLAQNYLSILGEDYEYEAQTGHVKDYPKFVGHVSVPKKLGYKAIFADEDDVLADASDKGLGTTATPFIHEGFPPKPATPTMKWLMKQLEKRSVGTGATRTSTYAEITKSGDPKSLLQAVNGRLSLTNSGQMNYRLLPGTHIGDIALTERVFAQMKDIADGKADRDVCLHEIAAFVQDDIETMRENSKTMRKELGITVTEQKEKYDGVWSGKKVSFNRVYSGHRFTDAECEALCRGEEIEVRDLKSEKTGATYGVKGKLSEQSYNGHSFVGFERIDFLDTKPGASGSSAPAADRYTGTWKRKKISFKREWGGHYFTDAECEALCRGEEIQVDNLVSAKGNTYSIMGKLAKQTFNGHEFVGFQKTGYANQNEDAIPKEWCKHVFTNDERLLLEAGQSVFIDGCLSKKGSIFSCTVKWGEKEDGRKGIIASFN